MVSQYGSTAPFTISLLDSLEAAPWRLAQTDPSLFKWGGGDYLLWKSKLVVGAKKTSLEI